MIPVNRVSSMFKRNQKETNCFGPRRIAACYSIAALMLVMASVAYGQARTETIAQSGLAVPGGNGAFSVLATWS